MTDREAAAPFTEDSTKQALVDHLRDAHGYTMLGRHQLFGDAKKVRITKAEMVRIHENHHETLDKPRDQVRVMEGKVYDGTHRYGVLLPVVEHVHDAVTVRPEVAEALAGIRSGDNPLAGSKLSAGERSALTRVIDNDYATLKTDLQQLAAQALQNDLAQLELDWADRRANVSIWSGKMDQLRARTADQFEELRQAAERDGIEVKLNRAIREQLSVNVYAQGYEKEKRELGEANKRSLDTALLALERERLRAQRQVLLTGITPEAQTILDTIPSAEQMLGQAMAADANRAQLTGAPTGE